MEFGEAWRAVRRKVFKQRHVFFQSRATLIWLALFLLAYGCVAYIALRAEFLLADTGTIIGRYNVYFDVEQLTDNSVFWKNILYAQAGIGVLYYALIRYWYGTNVSYARALQIISIVQVLLTVIGLLFMFGINQQS